eukprot:gb/GFBE01051942.1/.p1 GENE.gb/GFBE01051942.1/~~gb/GFBE01051942.1/.p1  ORF type:complete len:340 (+),score=82.32 gb/GFBE01051942.1/:1-1020(+)
MAALKEPLFKVSKDFNSPGDSPSRQTTDTSTAASDGDATASAFGRLSPVPEQRGWKHFFRHQIRLPLVFIAGLVLGAVASATLVLRLSPSAEVVPYPSVLPPAEVPVDYMAAKPLDNSCVIKRLEMPAGPQSFDACGFVIRSTDEVWNLRGDVDAAIEKYFHEDYVDAGSWGRRIIGKKALREAVYSEMRAFPDIQIHITDCVCRGNDIDGYKCAMPDILTGTNTGPSGYGPATGKFARWTGLVESLVQKNAKTGQWQYVAEWGVHDEWALIQQLGLDFSKVPHPVRNTEPIHDCEPLLTFSPALTMDSDDEKDMEEHQKAKAAMRATSLRAGRSVPNA